MSEPLLVERRGAIVWITLNRPEVRNALSREVNQRLWQIASEFEFDHTLRGVVITGAGDKTFCAGADLKERKGVPAHESGPYISAIANAMIAIGRIRVPTIAAMNGSAYGGGLELALACDFRILVEGAELGLTEVRLGIMPGAGGTQRLPRLVGEARAKELILLGRRINAAHALAIGLVHEVVARDRLMATVDRWLGDLASCAPLSLIQAKTAIEAAMETPLEAGLDLERKLYDVTLMSADRDEGLAAFAEGRAPQFRGE